jgi:transposase-like protein
VERHIGGVSETKPKYWSKLIAEQEASGQKVLPFCRERGITEPSFYYWRKRLRKSAPVRFALLETVPAATVRPDSALELVLKNGERLRIGNQVEAATLRMVLEAVRG